MKGTGFFLSVLMIMTCLTFSRCKKSDNTSSNQPERKKYAWVVGQKDSTGFGMILFSADCGETWTRQGQDTATLKDISLYDVWAVDENNVWAVGSDNAILTTRDGGKNWVRIAAPSLPSKPRLSAISIVNKTNIWISGTEGTVYNSADNGKTWNVFDTAFFPRALMQGICAVTPQKVYVVGGDGGASPRGFIGFTLDGGATWNSLVPENDFNKHEWIGVTSYGNTIVVYGGNSFYLVSTDGGANWKNDSVKTNGGGGVGADLNHLMMLDNRTWWGAFDMNRVYMTADGGSVWADQQTDVSGEFLIGIDAWNNSNALAVGESSGWPQLGSVLKYSAITGNWETKKTLRSNLSKISFVKP